VDDMTGIDARPFAGIENGYRTSYRVRFDEAGPDGLARTSTLLRYAQDVAWRHSEDLGFDRDWYQARGVGWVVRAVELQLHAAIPIGHTLQVSTAVVGHKRIWARRLGECHLSDGRLAARLTTDWVLLDGRNRIVRIPDDFGVVFVNPEAQGEIIRVAPAGGPPAHSLTLGVRPRDLDPLDHVNNAVYVDWLDEALEAAGWRRGRGDNRETWRLEYLAPAERDDVVKVEIVGEPAGWSARIHRGDGLELVRAEGSLPTRP
jgi:acyl-CoA thioesterase FadM